MMFKLDHNADINGICLQGTLSASYGDLVAMFGEPGGTDDGYKVSTCWTFVSEKGEPVRIYDWKSTNLYDDDEELPSVAEFREYFMKEPYEWHIGAHKPSVSDNFKEWFWKGDHDVK